MTDEDRNLLNVFEARIQQLLFQYDNLKKEKESLLIKMKTLQDDYAALMGKYADLKHARIISIRNEDVDDTKQRLSKLVREIDKCLALLNS